MVADLEGGFSCVAWGWVTVTAIRQDIKKNESLNQTNIKVIRPGLGLAPKHFNNIIGSKARKGIKKGTPLSWDLLLKQP